MRIDSNQGAQPLQESQTSAQAPARGNPSATASSALGEDQAQLSGVHVQVQALVAQALHFPEIRQEKVSALRQAVLGGGYQSSPDQIAKALFDHMVAKSAA